MSVPRARPLVLAVLLALSPLAAAITAETPDAVRDVLRNGALEGPAMRINGFQLAYPGAALATDARSGTQSVDLALEGASPQPWNALGQVRAYPDDRVLLRDVAGVRYAVKAPVETPPVLFQHYLSLDTDADGFRDVCLLHTGDGALAPIAASDWTVASFDRATRYFLGRGDCPGGPDTEPLAVHQANPDLLGARVLSVHVQTVTTTDPWPAAPILVDDLELLTHARVLPGVTDLNDGWVHVVTLRNEAVVDGTVVRSVKADAAGDVVLDHEVWFVGADGELPYRIDLDDRAMFKANALVFASVGAYAERLVSCADPLACAADVGPTAEFYSTGAGVFADGGKRITYRIPYAELAAAQNGASGAELEGFSVWGEVWYVPRDVHGALGSGGAPSSVRTDHPGESDADCRAGRDAYACPESGGFLAPIKGTLLAAGFGDLDPYAAEGDDAEGTPFGTSDATLGRESGLKGILDAAEYGLGGSLAEDADGDLVADRTETDMTDNHALFIEPQNLDVAGPEGLHVVSDLGTFTFDVTVEHYPPGQRTGLPIPLDPARDLVLTLFDLDSIEPGTAWWKDEDRVLWTSADHPGSVARHPVDVSHVLRVTVQAADLRALAEDAEPRAVGAWAFYDVADGDAYTDALGESSEPAADFFSLARNAVRSTVAADALKLAPTPLVMSNPPGDADDDGHANEEEVFASVTPEEVVDAPFNDRATPLDRDGDGFSNTEEDRNNDGLVDPEAFETDPDDPSDHPVPVVLVEADEPLGEGAPVEFRAVVDYAPGERAPPGSAVTSYAWTFSDGATATGPVVEHAFEDSGPYTATVTVEENHGASATATKDVVVPNAAPVAHLVAAPADAPTGTLVTFDATLSSDPDGVVESYTWAFGDGTPVLATTDPVVTHVFANDGDYDVTVEVLDDHDADAEANVTIHVSNRAPTGDIDVSSEDPRADVPAVGRVVGFASTFTDADGTVASYLWSFGDGATSAAASPTHQYATPGAKTVTLAVTDDDGATQQAQATFEVFPLPVAAFAWSPEAPTDLDEVAFADASVAPAGTTIVEWRWDLDGAASASSAPTRTFPDDGAYDVSLVVVDARGIESDPVTQTIVVTNVGPTADFTVAPGPHLSSRSVAFTDGSDDPDGDVVAQRWDFGDGATSDETDPLHAFPSDPSTDERTYTVTLVVTDDDGVASAASTRTVRVLQDTDGDLAPDRDDADDDADGYADALEVAHGTDTKSSASHPRDTDRDGVPDDTAGAFAGDADDDGDGVTDAQEAAAGSDPKNAASTPDDFDGDGVPNLLDRTLGTALRNPVVGDRDPCFPLPLNAACDARGGPSDRDRDGWNDQQERLANPLMSETDPASPPTNGPSDTDADRAPDVAENQACTRQLTRDTVNDAGAGRCEAREGGASWNAWDYRLP